MRRLTACGLTLFLLGFADSASAHQSHEVKDAGAPSGSPPDSNISVHLGADITLWVETPDLSGVGGGLDLRFDVWFFSILFKAGYRLSPSRDGVLRHTLPVSITMLGVVGNSVRVGGDHS